MNIRSESWLNFAEQAYATSCLENYRHSQMKSAPRPSTGKYSQSMKNQPQNQSFHRSEYSHTDKRVLVKQQLKFEPNFKQTDQAKNPLFKSDVSQTKLLQQLLNQAEKSLENQIKINHNLSVKNQQLEFKIEKILLSKPVDELLKEIEKLNEFVHQFKTQKQEFEGKYVQFKEMYMQEFAQKSHTQELNTKLEKECQNYQAQITKLSIDCSKQAQIVEKCVSQITKLRSKIKSLTSDQEEESVLIEDNEIISKPEDQLGIEEFSNSLLTKYQINKNDLQVIINQIEVFLRSKVLFVKLGMPLINSMQTTSQLLKLIYQKWDTDKIKQAIQYRSWQIEEDDIIKLMTCMCQKSI